MDSTNELWHEIEGQAGAARRVLDDRTLQVGLATLASEVRASGQLLLTGMGASLHAAEAIASLLRDQGVRAWALPTSELVHYGERLPVAPTLAISQSGDSAEIVRLVERARAGVHGLTLNPDGRLAARGALVMPGGPERAFAATRSFTSIVAALMILADQLDAGVDPDGLPDALERALVESEGSAAVDVLRAFHDADTLIFTGRGPLWGVASYAALLFMELARVPSVALEAAQLRHGPLEVGRPGVTVTALTALGPTAKLVVKLAKDAAETGARTVLIDSAEPATGSFREVGSAVTRWHVDTLREADAIAPLAVACQIVAFRLAEARGIVPGVPLRSSKVTREE